MTRFLAISNRRGGVGKTTVTTTLAYGMAARAGLRVLVIDLDAQASTSIVTMGYERWTAARQANRMVGDYLVAAIAEDMMDANAFADGDVFKAADYTHHAVGDVALDPAGRGRIDILPAAPELDDREEEFMVLASAGRGDIKAFLSHFRHEVAQLVRDVDADYDVVLIDCAPGLSNVVWGALMAADQVLIPYFPDRTAEDNVGWLSKRLAGLGKTADQVRVVANRVPGRSQAADAMVSGMAEAFPALPIVIPAREALATALDFLPEPQTFAQKFGDAAPIADDLLQHVLAWIGSR